MYDTPILLLVFNRPGTTSRVMEELKKLKPKYLFVAADGPRKNRSEDKALCSTVKQVVSTAVDWDCTLTTLYREDNLGCGVAVSSAIDWFFEHVEEGIILEDDCVPSASFFSFCQELLAAYKYDERVMHISGNNFSFNKVEGSPSYYFTKYFTAWGWATWRRAWEKFDFTIPYLDAFYQSSKLKEIALKPSHELYWKQIFELVRNGKRRDIWDYQWILTCWYHNAYAITPSANLVQNIGFGEDATHTHGEFVVSNVDVRPISKIIHPAQLNRNKLVDRLIFKNFFAPPQYMNKLRDILYKIFPKQFMLQIRALRRKILPNLK
jgi:hypothetical protein